MTHGATKCVGVCQHRRRYGARASVPPDLDSGSLRGAGRVIAAELMESFDMSHPIHQLENLRNVPSVAMKRIALIIAVTLPVCTEKLI